MKKILVLLLALSTLFFVGCNNNTETNKPIELSGLLDKGKDEVIKTLGNPESKTEGDEICSFIGETYHYKNITIYLDYPDYKVFDIDTVSPKHSIFGVSCGMNEKVYEEKMRDLGYKVVGEKYPCDGEGDSVYKINYEVDEYLYVTFYTNKAGNVTRISYWYDYY